MIMLPDLYLEMHYLRHKKSYSSWCRVLWWMPAAAMIAFTVYLYALPHFAPDNMRIIIWYLSFFGILVIPKMLYAVCSFLGWRHMIFHHKRKNRGNAIGIVIAIIGVLAFFYGLFCGPKKLDVKHIDIVVKGLPTCFDGIKIVQFSDAHVGTFESLWHDCLERDVDSIIAQKADIVVFTGDIQNVQPDELHSVANLMKRIPEETGVPVYGVLGNHDYSYYQDEDESQNVRMSNERETQKMLRNFGWKLLVNEHTAYYSKDRKDSIIIAGEGNDGDKPHSGYADLEKTLSGVSKSDFVILLQHNPKKWEKRILPGCNAQITLSGHTHGGQVDIFGLRPTFFSYKHDYGLAEKNDRYLYVTSGLGGVMPFRLGMNPEIAVITLHSIKK